MDALWPDLPYQLECFSRKKKDPLGDLEGGVRAVASFRQAHRKFR